MFEKLLDVLVNSLENGNWLFALLVIGIALIWKLPAINEFIDSQTSKRGDFLKQALEIDAIKGATRSFAEEELNYLMFKKVTGITADHAMREKLQHLINASNGELKTSHIAHAQNFLFLMKGTLTVVLTGKDKFNYFLNKVLSGLLAIFALLFFALPFAMKTLTLLNFSVLVGFGILILLFALFISSQCIPYYYAKQIKPIIDHLEDKTSSSA